MLPEPTRSRHSTGVEGSAPKETGPARPESAAPPSISLPKGGGAIRGIGEKFAANPVTGTGVDDACRSPPRPGRGGFGPQLALSYDSGAGNGPFGFGWSLSLPSITRKTDKGLPQYRDARRVRRLHPVRRRRPGAGAGQVRRQVAAGRRRPRAVGGQVLPRPALPATHRGAVRPDRALDEPGRSYGRRPLALHLQGQHHHLVRAGPRKSASPTRRDATRASSAG